MADNSDVVRIINTSARAQSEKFRTFAGKIRWMTNDGYELIEAVYEVFLRARAAQKDALVMESATWLADRGFGKPVQIGQLLDGEGNAVAFTLWTPALAEEPDKDILELAKINTDDRSVPYTPSQAPPGNPQVKDLEPRDAYAYGLARAWNVGEREPRPGE